MLKFLKTVVVEKAAMENAEVENATTEEVAEVEDVMIEKVVLETEVKDVAAEIHTQNLVRIDLGVLILGLDHQDLDVQEDNFNKLGVQASSFCIKSAL